MNICYQGFSGFKSPTPGTKGAGGGGGRAAPEGPLSRLLCRETPPEAKVRVETESPGQTQGLPDFLGEIRSRWP